MSTAHLCPVCSMVATDLTVSLSYHGKTYHFCSQQCLENFNSRPKLYVGTHAERHQRKSIVKKRTFKLDIRLSAAEEVALDSALSAMMGVREVQVVGNKICISYDLLEATAEQLERQLDRQLEQAGNTLETGWSTRLKRGWIQYTEENELDNLAAGESACCNKAPTKG